MNQSRRQFLKTTGLAASGLALASLTGCSVKPSKRPNVLIIHGDDQLPEYLGVYGSGKEITPTIDSLAHKGMRFTQAYCSSSMCTPSRYSLFTGQFAGRCQHPAFLKEFPKTEPYSIVWKVPIQESDQTIARLFSQNGYQTGFVGKYHPGIERVDIDELPKFTQDDDPADAAVDAKLRKDQALLVERLKEKAGFDYAASVLWGNYDYHPVKKLVHHHYEWFARGAVDFLDQLDSEKPFLLYTGTTSLHGPNHKDDLDAPVDYTLGGKMDFSDLEYPSRESVKTRLKNMGEAVEFENVGMLTLDIFVQKILETLEKKELLDNTIVVYMADHNREPAKSTCYQKGVHVPFIMHWPGRIKPGSVSDVQVQNIDILPTLADLCGIKLSENHAVDGVSLEPVLKGSEDPVRKSLYFEGGYTRGVLKGQYKYIATRFAPWLIEKMKSGELKEAPNHLNMPMQGQACIVMQRFPGSFDPDQLYDLKSDPYEQHNVAEDPAYQNILTEMKAELKSYLDTFDHPFDLEIDPFYKTAQYKALADKARAVGTDHIPWWRPGNPCYHWPPES